MITYILYLTALWFTEGTLATTYVVPDAALNMSISPSHKVCPWRLAATAYARSMTSISTDANHLPRQQIQITYRMRYSPISSASTCVS
jgi:hypothetical protein